MALEFNSWIGGNNGIFSYSGVISLLAEEGEGWLAVSTFFVELHHWKEYWSQVWWGICLQDAAWADPFSQHDPLPSVCWLIHGVKHYLYQWQHDVAIAVNHVCHWIKSVDKHHYPPFLVLIKTGKAAA